MPWLGAIVPRSLIGAADAAYRARRQRDEHRDVPSGTESFERTLDKAELSVDRVAPTKRVEGAKASESEEGREDHERNIEPLARGRLDLEG